MYLRCCGADYTVSPAAGFDRPDAVSTPRARRHEGPYAIRKLGRITRRSDTSSVPFDATDGVAQVPCARSLASLRVVASFTLVSCVKAAASTAAARMSICERHRAAKLFAQRQEGMQAPYVRRTIKSANWASVAHNNDSLRDGLTGHTGTMSRGRPSERSLPPCTERCN